MKNLLSLLLLITILIPSGYSQPCLPQGIKFTTQSQIDSFQVNYPNCSEIQGNVFINEIQTGNIVNLNGLNSINSIGGGLWISNNWSLSNLNGLNNLKSIGSWLLIYDHHSLTSLSGLESLKTIGHSLTIGDFFQGGNYKLESISGLMNLDSIGSNLSICYNPVLTSLSGLENISYIGGGISIDIHYSLTTLASFNRLSSIPGSLHLQDNLLLKNLNGFDSLTNIGGTLQLLHNNLIEDFSGLNNLETIGAHLKIRLNKSLKSFSGLEKLTAINGIINIEDNKALESLSGLNNINSNSIAKLTIEYNSTLSYCHVKSVCDYLASPLGSVTIASNAMGCNNQTEVEDSRNTIGVSEIYSHNNFSIYPNPSEGKLRIKNKDGTKINAIHIYNGLGRLMFYETPLDNTIDVSVLSQGIYIMEIISDEFVVRQKLILK